MFNEFNSWLFSLGLFGVSAYLLGFAKETQKKKTFFSLLIVFVALVLPILFAAYRSSGADSFNYMRDYIYARRTPWVEHLEDINGIFDQPGYNVFVKVLGYFKSIRVFFGMFAAITVCSFYCATKELKTESTPLVMLLFYLGIYSTSFNIMRQCIAVSLIAYSYKYVFTKDFKKFLFFVIIASGFHTSALLALFTYFLWTKENKLIPTAFLVIVFMTVIVVTLNIDGILESFSDVEFEASTLQRYIGYGGKVEIDFKNRDFYLTLLLVIIFMVHYTRLVKVDGKNQLYILLFYLSACLGICGFINPFVKRIAMYFSIPMYWVLADIPKCYKDHHSVWSARLLVILYAVLRFSLTAILEQSALVPYVWILPSWARF